MVSLTSTSSFVINSRFSPFSGPNHSQIPTIDKYVNVRESMYVYIVICITIVTYHIDTMAVLPRCGKVLV